MNVPRNLAYAIVALLIVLVGTVVWSALPESCASWKDRHIQAAADSISFYGLDRSNERRALAIVESERPEGCR